MGNDDYPVLTGGTFFALVLEARPTRSKAKTYGHGQPEDMSETGLLAGLLRVMKPGYKSPSNRSAMQVNTSEYKTCKNNGSNLPFFPHEISAFDAQVRDDYPVALEHMREFVDSFIDISGSLNRDEWLVKALLDLIDQDKTIPDSDLFYINENGDPVTKAQMREMTSFCLPAFLLGIWHYLVVNRHDQNTNGRTTFERLCPPNNGQPRIYRGYLGDDLKRPILVAMTLKAAAASAENDDDVVEAEIVDDDADDQEPSKAAQSGAEPQLIQTPVAFITNSGHNPTFIHNTGVLNIDQRGR